jgi:coenzyme PQQ precursor peptide PqqA
LSATGRAPVAPAELIEYCLCNLPEGSRNSVEDAMAWTTPTLVEICIGLEINGYLPAEF